MIPERRKHVYYFFGGIYALFALALVYLLFFNTGLGIEEGEGRQVYVANMGSHTIKGITVSVRQGGQTGKIMEIAGLAPGERALVDYDFFSGGGEKEVVVEAPFHATVVKRVVSGGAEAPALKYEMRFPGVVYANAPFSFSLEICNSSANTENVEVGESHSPEFFSGEGGAKTATIPAGGCKEVTYSLEAQKAGKTTIYFNIKARNITKGLEKEIEVLE